MTDEKLLKPYMGYSSSPQNGVCLIFAQNVREAKRLGYATDLSWNWGSEYIDFRVKFLRNHDWLYKEADQEKLVKGEAHVIDDPASCKLCELWGGRLDDEGICLDCLQEMKLDTPGG